MAVRAEGTIFLGTENKRLASEILLFSPMGSILFTVSRAPHGFSVIVIIDGLNIAAERPYGRFTNSVKVNGDDFKQGCSVNLFEEFLV